MTDLEQELVNALKAIQADAGDHAMFGPPQYRHIFGAVLRLSREALERAAMQESR